MSPVRCLIQYLYGNVKTAIAGGPTVTESTARSVRTLIGLYDGTTGRPGIAKTAMVKPNAIIFDIGRSQRAGLDKGPPKRMIIHGNMSL